MKKSLSLKSSLQGIIIVCAFAGLYWLFPLVCKGWLSTTPGRFYIGHTPGYVLVSVIPIGQIVSLLSHVKRKKDISVSTNTQINLWLILTSNAIAWLFVLVPRFIIEGDADSTNELYQQLGDFYLRYGWAYIACMLLSTILGVLVMRHIKKDKKDIADADEQ